MCILVSLHSPSLLREMRWLVSCATRVIVQWESYMKWNFVLEEKNYIIFCFEFALEKDIFSLWIPLPMTVLGNSICVIFNYTLRNFSDHPKKGCEEYFGGQTSFVTLFTAWNFTKTLKEDCEKKFYPSKSLKEEWPSKLEGTLKMKCSKALCVFFYK